MRYIIICQTFTSLKLPALYVTQCARDSDFMFKIMKLKPIKFNFLLHGTVRAYMSVQQPAKSTVYTYSTNHREQLKTNRIWCHWSKFYLTCKHCFYGRNLHGLEVKVTVDLETKLSSCNFSHSVNAFRSFLGENLRLDNFVLRLTDLYVKSL